MRNAGWDFSIGGSQSTGTIRSAVRPPPVGEKKTEISYDKLTRKNLESGNHLLSASGNALQESPEISFGKVAGDPNSDEPEDNSHDYVSLISFSLSGSPSHSFILSELHHEYNCLYFFRNLLELKNRKQKSTFPRCF